MGYIPAESGFRKGLGALSEFTLVKPDWITFKPDSVPFEEAAGLTLTGLTAWKCLVDVGKLESGQRVLISRSFVNIFRLALIYYIRWRQRRSGLTGNTGTSSTYIQV